MHYVVLLNNSNVFFIIILIVVLKFVTSLSLLKKFDNISQLLTISSR